MLLNVKSEAKIAFLQSYPEDVFIIETWDSLTHQCPTTVSPVPFTQYRQPNKQLGRGDLSLLMS
uniref:Uncharacterized protein n=3 Tax=Cercopithecinae TaxID=9528 RepID=A0A2K5KW71_CERAT